MEAVSVTGPIENEVPTEGLADKVTCPVAGVGGGVMDGPMLAEQLVSVWPSPLPIHFQTQFPVMPVVLDAVPIEHRFVVGATENVPSVAFPQAPFTMAGGVDVPELPVPGVVVVFPGGGSAGSTTFTISVTSSAEIPFEFLTL